jgi:hypothetical protein
MSVKRSQLRLDVPFAPETVWGQYNNYRANGLVGSGIVHVVPLGLVLARAVFGHQVVRQAKQRDIVTIITPFPDSYILRTFKKVVSGGGGMFKVGGGISAPHAVSTPDPELYGGSSQRENPGNVHAMADCRHNGTSTRH